MRFETFDGMYRDVVDGLDAQDVSDPSMAIEGDPDREIVREFRMEGVEHVIFRLEWYMNGEAVFMIFPYEREQGWRTVYRSRSGDEADAMYGIVAGVAKAFQEAMDGDGKST